MDLLYNYPDRLEVPAEGPVWGLSCITHILDKLQSSYSQQNLRLQTSLLGNYHSLFTPSSEFNLSEHTKFRLLFDWEERRTRRDGILSSSLLSFSTPAHTKYCISHSQPAVNGFLFLPPSLPPNIVDKTSFRSSLEDKQWWDEKILRRMIYQNIIQSPQKTILADLNFFSTSTYYLWFEIFYIRHFIRASSPLLPVLRQTKFLETEEKLTGIYSGILTAGIYGDYSF